MAKKQQKYGDGSFVLPDAPPMEMLKEDGSAGDMRAKPPMNLDQAMHQMSGGQVSHPNKPTQSSEMDFFGKDK